MITNKQFVFLFLTLLGVLNTYCAYGQNAEIIITEDYYNEGGSRFSTIDPLVGKTITRRAMQSRGVFEYDLSGNMPDSLKKAIEVAVDIWSDYLPGVYCKLAFNYSNTITADIETRISFIKRTNDDTIYYPQSLYRKLWGESSEMLVYDAVIDISSLANWCIGISDTPIAKKNLTYAVIRSIAQSLGFGASLWKATRYICFGQYNGHSISDYFIFDNNGTYLNEIDNLGIYYNAQLDAFARNTGNIFICQQDNEHKMYAPSDFNRAASLKYLDNPNSIMHYDDSQILQLKLDGTTIEILKAIGWEFADNEIEIVGVNIDSTGITAASQSHQFYIEANGETITDHHWTYQLPLSSGSYQTVSTATTAQFTIPALQNPNNFKTSPDGIVYGKIVFTGKKNGMDVSAEYTLGLRLKPKVKHAEIISIEPNATYGFTYDVTIGVEYEGSYYVTATVEEEGSSNMYLFHSNAPYYANMTLSMLYLWDDTYVDVWAENSYGTDHFYLTITPEDLSALRRVTPQEFKPTLEKPQLVSLDFTYDSFDFDELYFRNCKIKLKFYCPEADYLAVYMFFDGDYFPYYSYGREHTSPDVIEFEFKGDDLWNTHYQAMSMTENGEYSDKSDLYYLKDYAKISDPAILEALGITGIKETYSENEKLISLVNGRLCAAFPPEEIVSMTLFSPNGKVVKTNCDNSMDVTQLSKGLYILSINRKNNKLFKKKIIL